MEEYFVPKLGKLLFRNPESPDPQIPNWFFAQGMAASHYATVESQKSLRDEDLLDDMQMISDRNLPVAIFHGIHDTVCPFDLAELMNKGIEGSKLVKYHESGHALNVEEKEKTNEQLMKFITAESFAGDEATTTNIRRDDEQSRRKTNRRKSRIVHFGFAQIHCRGHGKFPFSLI